MNGQAWSPALTGWHRIVDLTRSGQALISGEQAGDSAEAAEADPGARSATRDAVLDAHLAICILTTEV